MDAYTQACATWLEQRFRMTDDDGVYHPHAPVYGYDRTDPRFEKFFYDWLRSYGILQVLQEYTFSNALDVGSAEGYLAANLAALSGARVHCAELAQQPLLRASELYGLQGTTCDIHDLPFADGSFDLVLCSEVLEHIVAPERAIAELARITRRVLVVTTPARWNRSLGSEHDQPRLDRLHEHIHLFTDEDFIRLFPADQGQVTLLGVRPLVRGFNRLHVAMIRQRPPLGVGRALLGINGWLARPFRRTTAEFLAVFVKDPAAWHPAGWRKRVQWQTRVLNELLVSSVCPPLRLAPKTPEHLE